MEKSILNSGQELPVMEHFATLQGEGFHTGKAAYFVRLSGCDVGCHWCDVKDSWDATKHPKFNIDEIVSWVIASEIKICVITGGEPAMYNLAPLTYLLQQNDIKTHIETSGSHPITGSWDWITFSPKKFKAPLPESAAIADELKVVIFHKSDFEFAEKHRNSVSEKCLLYLQPEWDKRDQQMGSIVDYIKQHPEWRMSLQTHKYLNIP